VTWDENYKLLYPRTVMVRLSPVCRQAGTMTRSPEAPLSSFVSLIFFIYLIIKKYITSNYSDQEELIYEGCELIKLLSIWKTDSESTA
jgi:hypothetical protein